MLWLLTAIVGLGAAGVSVFATLNRLGGDVERAFRKAPPLEPSAFGEGAYGKIRGVATAQHPIGTPGFDQPCVVYELVIYEHTADSGWRTARSERIGVDIEVLVGDTVVRVAGHDIYLVDAPRLAQDGYATRTTVRYVAPGAAIDIVGTLTREVDDDPTATRDYRSVATRYRLIGKRGQPIVLSVVS